MIEKVVILGSGESGLGAAILAAKYNYDVFISDIGIIAAPTKLKLQEIGVEFEEGGHSKSLILAANTVVKSPGISDSNPLILELLTLNIAVISEIEFAFRHIGSQAKIIAVTGTNGKTTTTLLIYHLLKTAGFRVGLAGNVGYSLAKRVAEGNYDYYVVEISSFQLDGIISFKPDISVLLNITPDHLDRYDHDLKKYVSSKFRIVENVSEHCSFIYNADSVSVNEELSRRNVEASLFAISTYPHFKKGAFIDDNILFSIWIILRKRSAFLWLIFS